MNGETHEGRNHDQPSDLRCLPCNVILRDVAGGVGMSAIDPAVSMRAIDNQDLLGVVGQVRELLGKAVEDI